MGSRTRENLIEVAKQLFISKGVDNTTIGDIADASDRGRRTIYTYFKNKREIFRAVIERESDRMVADLKAITESKKTASEKLAAYINAHGTQYRRLTPQNSALKSFFTMDFHRSERMRKLVVEKEEAMLLQILKEGVNNGEFNPDRAFELSNSLFTIIRASEQMPQTEASRLTPRFLKSIVNFVVAGVKNPPVSQESKNQISES